MRRSNPRPSTTFSPVKVLGLLGLATVFLVPVGCYRHVVGTKNAPGYTGPVYEANVDEGNENLFQTKTVKPKGSYYVD